LEGGGGKKTVGSGRERRPKDREKQGRKYRDAFGTLGRATEIRPIYENDVMILLTDPKGKRQKVSTTRSRRRASPFVIMDQRRDRSREGGGLTSSESGISLENFLQVLRLYVLADPRIGTPARGRTWAPREEKDQTRANR